VSWPQPARLRIARGRPRHELAALVLDRLPTLLRLLAVEILAALDPGLERDRARVQRVAAPDHEVAVFPRLERAHAARDPELPRRIRGHERQCRLGRQAAVFHGLGRLDVQPAGQLVGVGVERDEHAALVHERARVRDRVVDLELVRPPVGETGGARAVLRDLVGHLVSLQHVLERGDPHAKLLGHAQHLEDLVLPIRMAVHLPLALEDLRHRLELEVGMRRDRVGLLRLRNRRVFGLPAAIVARGHEPLADEARHAHARGRVALRVPRRVAPPLRVLAQRELDALRRAGERELVRRRRVAQLEDRVLAADGVGRSVEGVDGGQAAGQLAVDRDIERIEHVADADLRRDGVAGLVHAAVDRTV
jgi:hypothetical protein